MQKKKKGVQSLMDAFSKGATRSMLQFNMNINFDNEETQAVILKKYFTLFCDFPLLPQIPFSVKKKNQNKFLKEIKQKR